MSASNTKRRAPTSSHTLFSRVLQSICRRLPDSRWSSQWQRMARPALVALYHACPDRTCGALPASQGRRFTFCLRAPVFAVVEAFTHTHTNDHFSLKAWHKQTNQWECNLKNPREQFNAARRRLHPCWWCLAAAALAARRPLRTLSAGLSKGDLGQATNPKNQVAGS